MIVFNNTIHRDFSGCDVLWFSQRRYDFGSFTKGTTLSSSLLRDGSVSGRWLESSSGHSDVVSCSWSKSITGQASGAAVLQLKQGMDWKNLILPGDALLIFMSGFSGINKLKTTFEAIVFVDRVEEARAVDGSGATVEVVSVTGRDIGKIFEETSTVFDPALLSAVEKIAYTESFFGRLNDRKRWVLSPTELVLSLIDLLFGPTTQSLMVGSQWRFPGAEDVPISSLLDVSSFVQTPTFGYCDPHIPAIAEAGNFWQLLQSYQNGVVNEMFVDVRDLDVASRDSMLYQQDLASAFVDKDDVDAQVAYARDVQVNLSKLGDSRFGVSDEDGSRRVFRSDAAGGASTVAFVFRQKPYDTGSFYALPVVEVDETEVLQSNIGRAYHNVRNFFRMSSPVIPPLLQEAVFGIMVNKSSFARNGIRRFDFETRYTFATSQLSFDWDSGSKSFASLFSFERVLGTFSFPRVFEYYVNLVSTWHAFNERFWEGSLTLKYRPDIRSGVRLQLKRGFSIGKPQVIDFYVEGIGQNFAYSPGRSQTQVRVVRGIDSSQLSREDDGSLVAAPEAGLYWTKKGRKLSLDPYDYFVSEVFRKPDNT